MKNDLSQRIQNIFITFVQYWTNVTDIVQVLYNLFVCWDPWLKYCITRPHPAELSVSVFRHLKLEFLPHFQFHMTKKIYEK